MSVWHVAAPGNISQALTQHPELYTHALGHIWDLTLTAFAYLKLPLALAALAFGGCATALVFSRNNIRRTVLVVAASMIVFFQAARIALVRFDSYLGSYPLAESLQKSPPGQLIEADSYYAFSSVFFYTNRTALLLNGRNNNLEYGSYAPGAPDVFIDDNKFTSLWTGESRWYLLAYGAEMPHLEQLVGRDESARCSRERAETICSQTTRCPEATRQVSDQQFHISRHFVSLGLQIPCVISEARIQQHHSVFRCRLCRWRWSES